jgi:putative DNA primase/helicase
LPDSDAKLDMKDVLAEEFPGILAWAVRGCLDWQEEGLAPPACVLEETAAYRKDQDVIGQFLDECTQVERTTSAGADGTLAADLFNAFQGWAKGRNEFVMTSNAFGRKLTDRRIHKHPSRSGAVYSIYLSSEGERCRFQTTSSRYN